MSLRGFASVILDVDSTLSGLEGIDWLAELRGPEASAQVVRLTERAMAGEIALDSVYGERLSLVNPTSREVDALARAYIQYLAPGAEGAVHSLAAAGRRVVIVSGGLREAILPLATTLGIPHSDVHAVSVRFDAAGQYAGFDTESPLTTASGKRGVAAAIGLTPRVLAVGDGATDLAIRPAVDAFAAFTGFVRRAPVADAADLEIASFDQLTEIVLA